jgi:phospholipid/cholesterol/gamma-HCH transport system substrate-binding protein
LPSQKEIQWAQLRVGVLIVVAMVVLIGLLVLMSGTTGGLFAHKLSFRSYFVNASGVKPGAPVTLEGVTIGNVTHVRVVPARNPTPVEVTIQVGEEFFHDLHTDSTVSIAQAGVLGDSFIDIDSELAKGPQPENNAELKTAGAPTIQDVIHSSQVSIDEVHVLTRKIETLVDAINNRQGAIGELVSDPAMARKVTQIANDLAAITSAISHGDGSLGKLIKDDTLYDKANNTIAKLSAITDDLNAGKGSAGKLLKDDALYTNLNSAVANANQLLAEINAGKGSIGMLAKDPAFARKVDDAVTRLDGILKGVDEGKGTLGQLAQNRSLYDHADATLDQSEQLVKAIREDPKKYFVIRLKLF